jgi:hypothetical protein
VESGTVTVKLPLELIVITTLQPVAVESGECGNGFDPLPAGQTLPAQLATLPIATSASVIVHLFIDHTSVDIIDFR